MACEPATLQSEALHGDTARAEVGVDGLTDADAGDAARSGPWRPGARPDRPSSPLLDAVVPHDGRLVPPSDAAVEPDGPLDEPDVAESTDAADLVDSTPDAVDASEDAAVEADLAMLPPDAARPDPDAARPDPDAARPDPDAMIELDAELIPDVAALVEDMELDLPIDVPEDRPVDAPEPPPLPPCPEFENPVNLGNVREGGVIEASGVAESRRNPGVLWMHNDSGDTHRVFAVGRDGTPMGIYDFSGARLSDTEDLAIGPGPEPNVNYVYVGDVGDNAIRRASIRVRRFPEPRILPMVPTPRITLDEELETFTLRYPDGSHNCESIMIDPANGDFYVMVKSGDGVSPVYRAPAPLSNEDGDIIMEQVANLNFGPAPLNGSRNTTAADISPSGREIIVRTYSRVFLWRRPPGMTVGEAFGTPVCPMPHANERQGEAIGYGQDDNGYYTVSEGANQPIFYFERR